MKLDINQPEDGIVFDQHGSEVLVTKNPLFVLPSTVETQIRSKEWNGEQMQQVDKHNMTAITNINITKDRQNVLKIRT